MGGLAAGGGRVQRAAGQGEHCEHLGGSLPRGIGRAVPHGACGPVVSAVQSPLRPLPGGPGRPAPGDGLPPAFLVRGGLSDRVGLADRLWGLSGGNAAPPAITPSQGEGRVCHGKEEKQHQRPRQKGALVLFTERTRFRSGPGTGTGERGCPMRLFPSPRTGRPSPGLQPGLPGPWRQSTGRRFSGCGPR